LIKKVKKEVVGTGPTSNGKMAKNSNLVLNQRAAYKVMGKEQGRKGT